MESLIGYTTDFRVRILNNIHANQVPVVKD
jgi:hypothetical protein